MTQVQYFYQYDKDNLSFIAKSLSYSQLKHVNCVTMRTILAILSAFLLLNCHATKHGRNQPSEYQIDRTLDLIGLTVYFEYLYYPGNWVVPWNYGMPHYTGTVNPISPEEDVFDPYERAQMRSTELQLKTVL